MRRTIAAVLIFVFALGFSAYCEIYSARVTQTLWLRAIYSLLCFERLASSSESSFINVSISLN